MIRILTIVSLIGLVLIRAAAWGQVIRGQYYNPNDERFKFLALEKSKVSLKESKARYERAKTLLEKDMLSNEEFERYQTDYDYAELEYQQALLTVIFEKPKIVIDKAVKYVSESGERRVKLTLRSTAGGSFDLDRYEALEDDSFASRLKPDMLYNVYVSLKSGETIIGIPYMAKIPVLKVDEAQSVDFLLLKNLDEVIVSINYADKVEDSRIYLQKGQSAEKVSISPLQFSQEANLGSRVTYDLTLERFGGGSSVFKLSTVNLPDQITYDFVDPTSGARLSQVKFMEGITSQDLSLNLFLPERSGPIVVVDTPIFFYAVALDQESVAGFEGRMRSNLSPEEIGTLRGGKVKLELIPRGLAKIDLLMQRLFYEISVSDDILMDLRVRNAGTKDLSNVSLEASLPYGWQARIESELIPILPENCEQLLTVTVLPPQAIDVGDYQIKIKANCMVDNLKVESDEKLVRVTVKSTSNLIGISILVLLLVGLVVGIIVFGIRMTRR